MQQKGEVDRSPAPSFRRKLDIEAVLSNPMKKRIVAAEIP